MHFFSTSLALTCLCAMSAQVTAQASTVKVDTVATVNLSTTINKLSKWQKVASRLSLGMYGEAAFTREFYSDNPYRYSKAANYKNDPSHGKFDIPHVAISLGYDFGKGWSVGTEIEFEHGGTGSAYEKEYEESGEWEHEVEKGGEVELEQFWIQKSFQPAINLRAGHLIVPVGYTNLRHEPLRFFTVYRPEGENTILPCTWHQTGISVWGNIKNQWRYEFQFLAGLNAMNFNRNNWIQKGASSPMEFDPANKYALVGRIDNYSIDGLRIGLSGYYGHSIDNTLGRDKKGLAAELKGQVIIGAVDFTLDRFNWIVRGSADYGYLSDAINVLRLPGRQTRNSPFSHDPVGKNAVAIGLEAGYNLFSQLHSEKLNNQRFYVFGRYDYYNSYIPARGQQLYPYTERQRVTCGINYMPIPQVVIKAEYANRFLKKQYNNEPSVSLGVAFQGNFL